MIVSKKFLSIMLMSVLITTIIPPSTSYANTYSDVDTGQVSDEVDEVIIKQYEDLGLDVQSDKVKDKIKYKKILVDNRNNEQIIKQSYIKPELIYQEELVISGYEFNENNNIIVEVDPISAPMSPSNYAISDPILSSASLTWDTETKSSTAVISYKGTYVTLNYSISAQICDDVPGFYENEYLIEFKNMKASYSSSNSLDAGDPEYYINDYNGGYVRSYDYKFIQAGYPYNGINGEFTCSGSETFNFWQSSAGYTYTIAPRGCNRIRGEYGFLSGYADFFVIFYGGTSSDIQYEMKFLNGGWGDILSPF